MVDLLVRDTDIDVNAKTQVGMTALHLVCMNGDIEICRTLLRYDADIRAKTADESTPLHTAIFNCNTHLAELLIKQGQWVDFIKQLCFQCLSSRRPVSVLFLPPWCRVTRDPEDKVVHDEVQSYEEQTTQEISSCDSYGKIPQAQFAMNHTAR